LSCFAISFPLPPILFLGPSSSGEPPFPPPPTFLVQSLCQTNFPENPKRHPQCLAGLISTFSPALFSFPSLSRVPPPLNGRWCAIPTQELSNKVALLFFLFGLSDFLAFEKGFHLLRGCFSSLFSGRFLSSKRSSPKKLPISEISERCPSPARSAHRTFPF